MHAHCTASLKRFTVLASHVFFTATTPILTAQDSQSTGTGTDQIEIERLINQSEPSPVLVPEGSRRAEQSPSEVIGMLIGEGAFIAGAYGELVGIDGGGWAIRLLSDDRSRTVRAMVVQPTERLEEMLRFIGQSDSRVIFRVSGQVFAYEQLNYLLITAFTIAGESDNERVAIEPPKANPEIEDSRDEPSLEEDQASAPQPLRRPGLFELFDLNPEVQSESPSSAAQQSESGSESDIQTELDRVFEGVETPSDRIVQPSPSGVVIDDTLEGPSTNRSGETISNRVGRLVPGEAGSWIFVMDNDADVTPSGSDAPLTVLPCLLLESMQSSVERLEAGAPEIVLSGRVFVFRGQGYILPSVYSIVLNPADGLASGR